MKSFGLFDVVFMIVLAAVSQCIGPVEKENQHTTPYQSQDFTTPGQFTSGIEGPAADDRGNIYVVNFGEKGTIGIVNSAGEASLFVRLPTGSTGNGIRLNKQGDLLVADYTGHNVLLVNRKTRSVSVFALGEKMNQPNDIAIASNGTLYASDPNWKESTGNLWRIDPDQRVVLLDNSMGTTNGVEVSPDEKTLYVNESVQLNVWAFDLSPAGDISNKRLLTKFKDHGMDGMRCDVKGNLYITRHGKGTVAIVSPEGKLLREIKLTGKKPSNITFGGPDGKTCYVTLQDRGCLESFRSEHAGREWKMFELQ